jgi:hypothetical protein
MDSKPALGRTRTRHASGPIGDELLAAQPYLGDVATDNLHTIALQLAAALWVTRDRMAAMEALLVDSGVLTHEQVELYRVPEEREPARQAERQKFISDIFRVLHDRPG